ncbi:MAG: DUF6765 family protein [Mariprofundus sp.]
MQIDFHHGTTYVLARLAGFDNKDAATIAHAAQYVDDATSSGAVYFDNKALYQRISSAHKMVDPRNTKALANHLVWLPFHFLPGNDGLPAGQDTDRGFIHKIVCTPDSPVARDMVRQCILDKNRSYGLHRLGVTMHVYADTWAHQGFAGVLHEINEVEDAIETTNSGVFSKLGDFLRDILDDAIPPLGHGRANVFPDMPFLSWQYTNGIGQVVTRNNTDDFCRAAEQLCITMQRYIAGDPDAVVAGLLPKDMTTIRDMFTNTKMDSGEERHAQWLSAIASGAFSFGAETVSYNKARGKGSWKDEALGTSYDMPVHSYKKGFLSSDWKMFHDAVQAHRFYVIHDLLPRYGICAA